MTTAEQPFLVPQMSKDPRVRVYRRSFAHGTSDQMDVDAFVMITSRYVVVLDTLLGPEDMDYVVHDIQGELVGRELLVVNSHADWDHCWGNSYFVGEHAAPIIAQDYSAARIESDEAKEILHEYQQKYPYLQNVVLVPPTLTFADKLTIYGGDLTLELFSAPGHHSDHIAVWIPEIRLLLAFDGAETPLPLIESADSVGAMYNTLEHFLALEPQRVLCAHGKSTDISVVQRNVGYMHEIEQRGRQLLAAHHPTDTELEHAPELLQYSFKDVEGIPSDINEADREFYTWAHENNVRYILQWLLQKNVRSL